MFPRTGSVDIDVDTEQGIPSPGRWTLFAPDQRRRPIGSLELADFEGGLDGRLEIEQERGAALVGVRAFEWRGRQCAPHAIQRVRTWGAIATGDSVVQRHEGWRFATSCGELLTTTLVCGDELREETWLRDQGDWVLAWRSALAPSQERISVVQLRTRP